MTSGYPYVLHVGYYVVTIDEVKERITRTDGTFLSKGDIITLDGSTGLAYIGDVAKVPAAFDEDYQTVLQWADKYKRMAVFANAESVVDMNKAVELGAEGLGLCRTEHMFFSSPDRIAAMVPTTRHDSV
jgi:pyruvate,orthophosphate dikinase